VDESNVRASDLDKGPTRSRVERLSKRELEIIWLISRGLSNQEIAEKLYLSINSVKTYIRSAYRRIDVSNRAHAVIWALENESELAKLGEADARAKSRRHGPGHPLRSVPR
jgi:DNA-binding CsgD family transcriptional regulator